MFYFFKVSLSLMSHHTSLAFTHTIHTKPTYSKRRNSHNCLVGEVWPDIVIGEGIGWLINVFLSLEVSYICCLCLYFQLFVVYLFSFSVPSVSLNFCLFLFCSSIFLGAYTVFSSQSVKTMPSITHDLLCCGWMTHSGVL